MSILVAAFYKFIRIDEVEALRVHLHAELASRDMKGTILLAPEGINGTISGVPAAMASFLAGMRADPRFSDLTTKEASANTHPFQRLKVKVKREILTLNRPEADPTERVGIYVKPQDWNRLITDPDVLVIDTRNRFEVEHGTFKGAVDPGTQRFSEFPAYVEAALDPGTHRKIAMFCTGGIRCEKATAFLLAHGFSEVYHLDGGILRYLSEVPVDESLWQGKCFVFDERETVGQPRSISVAKT